MLFRILEFHVQSTVPTVVITDQYRLALLSSRGYGVSLLFCAGSATFGLKKQYTLHMKINMMVGLLFASCMPSFAQLYTVSDLGTSPSEAPGWLWESFADTVMGGKSELVPPAIINTESGNALLLAGKVITKGGGFIQVRLKYSKELFDATSYTGVEVEVDASSEGSYFVFLRTKDNNFPWSYYAAPFKPQAGRTKIRIPWASFSAESTLRKTVRPEYISSVALVAANKDFNAYLRIYGVRFYK